MVLALPRLQHQQQSQLRRQPTQQQQQQQQKQKRQARQPPPPLPASAMGQITITLLPTCLTTQAQRARSCPRLAFVATPSLRLRARKAAKPCLVKTNATLLTTTKSIRTTSYSTNMAPPATLQIGTIANSPRLQWFAQKPAETHRRPPRPPRLPEPRQQPRARV